MSTDDERYLVVDGRRWRRTDPAIPEPLRKELVAELMDARRAVRAATDEAATAAARARVDRAKRALGERGAPWWDEPSVDARRDRLEATVLALAGHRAPRTICPSDAARIAGGERWRRLMDDARDTARELARSGRVELLQKGEVLDPDGEWKGPIRIRAVEGSAPGPAPDAG